ncbi:MAG: hypothetical protein AAGE01_05760 [Pseudomonadota bacterium]
MTRIFLLALLLLAAPAIAQDDREEPAEPELVPAGELTAETRRMLDRKRAELRLEPDGRQVLDLRGGHRHLLMARVGPDGKIETYCATAEAAARRWLLERTPPEAPE